MKSIHKTDVVINCDNEEELKYRAAKAQASGYKKVADYKRTKIFEKGRTTITLQKR